MTNEVVIRVTAQDNASAPLQSVRSSVMQTAAGFATGLIATQAFATGVNFLKDQVSASVSAFMESEAVTAKLNAVLKSTHGVAGVTAGEVQNLSTQLEHLTGTSDEEITNAQTLLLTFTSIGKDIFPQATRAAMDMSNVFGQDLQSSAIQLGKALNDPIGGVTSLRRVGVQLTDQQEDAIKKFVELGEVEKAQAVILQELQTEVGGAAEAFGTTAAGKLAIFNQTIDDMRERLGGALVEGLTPLIDRLNEWSQSEDAQEFISSLVTVIEALAAAIIFTVDHFKQLKQAVEFLFPVLAMLKPAFDAITATIRAVGDALDAVSAKIAAVKAEFASMPSMPSLGGFGGALESLGGMLVPGLGGLGSLLGIPQFADGGTVPGTGPQLAVVHGGETVIPAGQSMGGVTLVFNGDMYGIDDLGRKVAEALNRAGFSGPVLNAGVVAS